MALLGLCCSYTAAVVVSLVALPQLFLKIYEEKTPTILILPPVYPDYIGFEQLKDIAKILAVFLPIAGVQFLQWCTFIFQLTACTTAIGAISWSLVLLIQQQRSRTSEYMTSIGRCVKMVWERIFRRTTPPIVRDTESDVRPSPPRRDISKISRPREGRRPTESSPGEAFTETLRSPMSRTVESEIIAEGESNVPDEASSSSSDRASGEREREEARRGSEGSLESVVLPSIRATQLEAEMSSKVQSSFTEETRHSFGQHSMDNAESNRPLLSAKKQADERSAVRSRRDEPKTTPLRDPAPNARPQSSLSPVEDIVPDQSEEPSAPPMQDDAHFHSASQRTPSSTAHHLRMVEETLHAEQAHESQGENIVDHQDVKYAIPSDSVKVVKDPRAKSPPADEDSWPDVQHSTSSDDPGKLHDHHLLATDPNVTEETAVHLEQSHQSVPLMSPELDPEVDVPDESSEGKGDVTSQTDETECFHESSAKSTVADDTDASKKIMEMQTTGVISVKAAEPHVATDLALESTQAAEVVAQEKETGEGDERLTEVKRTESFNERGEIVHTSPTIAETLKSSSQTASLSPQESAKDFADKHRDLGHGAESSEIDAESLTAILERDADTYGKESARTAAQEEHK